MFAESALVYLETVENTQTPNSTKLGGYIGNKASSTTFLWSTFFLLFEVSQVSAIFESYSLCFVLISNVSLIRSNQRRKKMS